MAYSLMFLAFLMFQAGEPSCSVETGLVKDCNGNRIAETKCPQDLCVVPTSSLIYEDENGFAHAVKRWTDSQGNLWIKAGAAVKDKDGAILVEADACK
jgi:hypothetical protein